MCIELINTIEEFRVIGNIFDSVFIPLPFNENPFNKHFKYFVSCEYDFIYHDLFLVGLLNYINRYEKDVLYFYALDPPPDKYYFDLFEKYSVFKIKPFTSICKINEVLTRDPTGNSHNSISISSNIVAYFSRSNEWAVLGSRDSEIAIIGFKNIRIKKLFFENFNEDATSMFTSVKKQVKDLDEMLEFNDNAKTYYDILVKNYRDRLQ